MEINWILPLVAAGVALLVWSWMKTPKNLPLNWDTLSTFMKEPDRYEVILDIDDRGLDADFSIQFQSDDESVMYFISEFPGHMAETIDLFRRGSAGLVVTFVNEKVSTFERIGGFTTDGASLEPQQLTALEGILRRTRSAASYYR